MTNTLDLLSGNAGPLARNTAARRAEYAAERIVEVAQRHPPGTRIGTKESLRKQCGVSVGTFNEALTLVQARGYISLKPGPGGGIFVNEQSAMARLGNSMLALDTAEPSISDAIRIRDALDPLLIDDAIDVVDPTDIEKMRSCLAAMRAAIEDDEHVRFVRANWTLHRIIAEVSPSWLLRSVYLSLLEMLESHTIGLASTPDSSLPDYIESRYELHEQIVEALADRDRSRAQELMKIHNLSN